MTHVLRSQQFSREFVTRLVRNAQIVWKLLSTSRGPVELKSMLAGRIMGLVFTNHRLEPAGRSKRRLFISE